MGEQSQIRLIEPKARTISNAPKNNKRIMPDDRQVERAFESFTDGKAGIAELSKNIGCSIETLSELFTAEYGPDWRKQRGTWL